MRRLTILVAIVGGILLGLAIAGSQQIVYGQAKRSQSIAAIPGEKGGWDITGPYDVVLDWPKPMSQLPGHEKWTWGAVEGIFAENPNRIFIAQRGELPLLKRPAWVPIPQFGPSLSFPVAEVPFRNASQGPVGSLPGGGAPGQVPEESDTDWKGTKGVDARWEHTLVVVDAEGKITEQWTQWDSLFKRPHAIYINPYDLEKHVWVVDDYRQVIFQFSSDGKRLTQTIGTLDQSGADDKHFNRPTFLAWLPDSTMFVADGYNGSRIAKFDKNGKFLLAWGMKGDKPPIRSAEIGPPPENRPGYLSVPHGIAVDPVSRRVYVSDRGNRRMQVFDENGNFIDQWAFASPSNVNFLYMSADRYLWAFDDTTSKVVKYDLAGHFLYSWGSLGEWPGGLFNMHGATVDQQGNLYIAEVGNGRAQKFRPRRGANTDFFVGKPVYSAWK